MSEITITRDETKLASILEAAITVFAKHGVRGTDVQEIADAAGVGKGTVYRYFGSKQDLFWASHLEVMRRVEQSVDDAIIPGSSALETLRDMSMGYARLFRDDPRYIDMLAQQHAEFRFTEPESHRERHDRLMDRCVRIIQRGIESGEIRAVDPVTTVNALGGLVYGNILHGFYNYENVNQDNPNAILESVELALDLFLEGLKNLRE